MIIFVTHFHLILTFSAHKYYDSHYPSKTYETHKVTFINLESIIVNPATEVRGN